MNATDISARIRRLEQLGLGVAREIQRVEKSDILLYRERMEYFDAMRRVWAGLESARVALAKARQRLDGTRAVPHGPRGH
jgi:hypothetical protein